MLTLSRRIGETILIGDDIEVYVSSIERGAVKLSIKAPKRVIIQRPEKIHSRRD